MEGKRLESRSGEKLLGKDSVEKNLGRWRGKRLEKAFRKDCG